jgi:hypothetical protein
MNAVELSPGSFETIVAAGDSYAAGSGASDQITKTATDRHCVRGETAPAKILAEQADARFYNIACAGQTPNDMRHTYWGTPSQITKLKELNPDLVQLSIGGNAIDLTKSVDACLHDGCGPGSPTATRILDILHSESFHEQLINTYDKVLHAAPNAEVYVTGYPSVVEPDFVCSGIADILALAKVPNAGYLANGNMQTIANTTHTLNQEIHRAVISAKDHHANRVLEYVAPPQKNGICQQPLDRSVVIFSQPHNPDARLHPSDKGNEDIANILASAIEHDHDR